MQIVLLRIMLERWKFDIVPRTLTYFRGEWLNIDVDTGAWWSRYILQSRSRKYILNVILTNMEYGLLILHRFLQITTNLRNFANLCFYFFKLTVWVVEDGSWTLVTYYAPIKTLFAAIGEQNV